MNVNDLQAFYCKQFTIWQNQHVFKIGTDGMLLGAWVDILDAVDVLEIGTGTGIISMMMAQRNKEISIKAIDVSVQAVALAYYNVQKSPFHKQIEVCNFRCQDFPRNMQFDLLVSNPPYFIESTKSETVVKNNAKHTDLLSHQELAESVVDLLKTNGRFSVVLPFVEGNNFIYICESLGMNLLKKTVVHTKKSKPASRLLLTFQKTFQQIIPVEDKLYIQKEEKDRTYTDKYVELTKAFYL